MIVDSDVLIEVLRRNRKTLDWMSERVEAGERLRCSPVSRAEIGAGIRKGEEGAIERVFAAMEVLPIDGETGAIAGDRLRRYQKSHRLELGDALVAASALQHGDILATFNRKHFPGVDRILIPPR